MMLEVEQTKDRESWEYISAGDLEKYGYCPLSWWLSLKYPDRDEGLDEGIAAHQAIGSDIADIRTKEGRSRTSEKAVLWFAMIATIIAMTGMTFLPEFSLKEDIGQILGILALIWLLAASFFLYRAETIHGAGSKLTYTRLMVGFAMVAMLISINAVAFILPPDSILSIILEIAALVWLVGAAYFLYRALTALNKAAKLRELRNVATGEIEYVDVDADKPRLLRSERYMLTGRPDFILEQNGIYIPVEVKTGRSPKGPFFSHVLQIGAYCMVVADSYGKAPPYGIVRYESGDHRVEYTPKLRKLVLEKLEEMHEARKKGEAHRNHNRDGKCYNCSRRQVCPERLA